MRGTANDFQRFARFVRKVDKVAQNVQQRFTFEQLVQHRVKGFNAVSFFSRAAPGIKVVQIGEYGTRFCVHAVGNDNESVVLVQFGNVAAVAHGQLCERAFDGDVFVDGRFQLHNDQRQAVDEHDNVGAAGFGRALDCKLIDDFEKVFVGGVIVDKAQQNVLVRGIVAMKNDAVGNPAQDVAV